MVIKHKSWIECDVCGVHSPYTLDGIGVARRMAEETGWLVGWPSGRRKGKPDYCADHKPADEAVCMFSDTTDGHMCGRDAQYMFCSHGKNLPCCGRHQPAMLKGLFNGDPDQELVLTRLREPYQRSASE